jgi:hypothetical protein
MYTKKCPKCGETKKRGDFYKRSSRKCGLSSHCKDCINALRSSWSAERINRVKKRARERQIRKFGISIIQHDYIFETQEGKCAICHEKRIEWLCVDHDHKTLKVRGLLCSKCNLGIANFNDSPIIMLSAFRYLIQHSARGIKWSLFLGRLIPTINDLLDIKVNNANNTATSGKTS